MSGALHIEIRGERPADAASIREVHCAAFPTDAEARLVERLRNRRKAIISLVAEVESDVVGHILFSPVTVPERPDGCGGLGLAPVAVLPDYQRRGVGMALIRAGLASCRAQGHGFVVLLGHPEYYPRFGFERASTHGISNEYGADEAFMVLALKEGALPPRGSLVRYAPEFGELSK